MLPHIHRGNRYGELNKIDFNFFSAHRQCRYNNGNSILTLARFQFNICGRIKK